MVGSGAQHAHGLIEGAMNQAVGLFLTPLQAALVAVEADLQGVLLTGAYLAGEQHAAGILLGGEQHGAIVVQRTTRHMGRQVRADTLDTLTTDEFRQAEGVGADIANATALPGQLRVAAPGGLPVALPGEIVAEPALWVFDVQLAQSANRAGLHLCAAPARPSGNPGRCGPGHTAPCCAPAGAPARWSRRCSAPPASRRTHGYRRAVQRR